MKFPRNPMRDSTNVPVIAHHAVSTANGEGCPDPAFVRSGLPDVSPEAFTSGASARSHATRITLHIKPYAQLFIRGLVQVALVSANTRQIAAGRYSGAFIVGGLISLVWWSNSSKDRPDFKGAGVVYALGAASGTVLGMWLAR